MIRLNVLHGCPVDCDSQKFFEITSFRTTLSSACSPTSLSSWRFLSPTGAKVWRQGGHATELAAPFVKGRIRNAMLTAKIGTRTPASACRKIPIICSSVNLLRFTFVLLCQKH